MNLEFTSTLPRDQGVVLIPVAKGDGLEIPVTALGADGILAPLEALGATGAHGEITRILKDNKLIIAFGLGDSDEIDQEAVRRAAGCLARSLKGVTHATITTELGIRPIVEGLLLGGYSFRGAKSDNEIKKGTGTDSDIDSAADSSRGLSEPARITVVCGDEEGAREEFDRAIVIAESTLLARDLVNTPANILYPESYAEIMSEVAAQSGLDIEVFDEEYLKDNGFGGIIAVGQGSVRPPRLVHLTWNGGATATPSTEAPSAQAPSAKTIALVGKGITFDTGGISLKRAPNMEEMISDMGGSAAQLAAIAAVARLGLAINVEAWLPLAENMPSGSATRPGDVIGHYGGLTSEVLNTDAEGRLVLADALARASEDEPDYLIETATLTGAQMVALGARTAGVMGSDDFRDRVAEIGRDVGENAWAMPLLEEQAEELSSPVADLRNSHNARTGGMLFAGLYLSRFVGDATEWVHIDVAGPAWNTGTVYGYTPKRATGAPVRTIIEAITHVAHGANEQLEPAS